MPPHFSYREGYCVAQFVLYILYEYHLFIYLFFLPLKDVNLAVERNW